MKEKIFKNGTLYLVTGSECSLGRSTFEVVEAAIRGGVDIVQMREKHTSLVNLVQLGKALSSLCKKSGVAFIVNDDPFLALEVGADGVHLGQEDIEQYSVTSTREMFGCKGIIGLSTHSVIQAKQGISSEADYIAFGPVFPTKTKDYFVGRDDLPEVLKLSDKPVVAIGGINGDNLDEVLSLGARNVAMIRCITEAGDIESRVKGIKERIALFESALLPLKVSINGNPEPLLGSVTIGDLLRKKGLKPEHVIIEHNSVIVPREKWKDVFLGGGDNIEIVSFVGGG